VVPSYQGLMYRAVSEQGAAYLRRIPAKDSCEGFSTCRDLEAWPPESQATKPAT